MQITQAQISEIAEMVARKVSESIAAVSTPGRWLTLDEAKKYAKVKSRSTIKAWIDEGYIYGFKRTGEWIVDRESIDNWFGSERGY